jgi:tetratricopeptide (TPR) repeat protein
MNDDNKALSSALGTDMKPAPFKEPDYSKLRTLPQVFAEEKRVGDLQAQAAGDLKKAELTQQTSLLGEQAKAAKDIAYDARSYVVEAKEKKEKFPFPEFHPTKDNAESLAGLFSVVSTIGIMLGSSGKQSGLNAMNAMTGMMSGWQKGRADLFKREKEEFDKEFNRIKTIHEDLRKDLEDYMKLLPYDKEAAMYKAAEISAKTGTDSIINSYIKKGQADNALKLLSSAAKLIEHEEDRRAKAAEKGAKITQQQQMAQRAVNSLGGVASALESIKELPAGTTTGLLPNLQTKDGLLNYVRNTLGRKVTKREAEEMNTIFTGIGRNLASIEASGAATGLSELSKQMQSGLYINSGIDDPYKVAIKLADIKRIAVENILPAIDSGTLTPGQAESARGLINRINQAIPFTTIEVIQAGRQPGKQTIGDVTTQAVEKGRLNQEKEKRLRELEAREKEQ